ncbi:hypothetical protein WA158_000790 [Blastocystis sp. Blastoise]
MSENNLSRNQRGHYSIITDETRKRIIDFYTSGATDFSSFCQTMKVNESTARSIISSYVKNGKVVRQVPSGRKAKVVSQEMKDQIINSIDENCCITLGQIRGKLIAVFPGQEIPSVSTIFRTINGLFYSTKKVQISPADRNSPTTIEKRHEYADWLASNRDSFNFVYVDESGFNLWEKRIFGRSKIGSPAIMVVDGQRGCNISLVLAISGLRGNVHHQFFRNSVGSEQFLEFLTGLCETLRGISTAKPFCIIMDNCSIHKTKEILDFLGASGIAFHFLPPWSPFLNPIEESFSSIKTKARSNIASFDWSKENILSEARAHEMTLLDYRYFILELMVTDSFPSSLTIENVQKWEQHSMDFLRRCQNDEIIL